MPIPEPRLEQFRGVGSKAGHWQPGLGSGLGPWIGGSGCSSREPYPPSRPMAIVAAPRLGDNRPLKLSRLGKPGSAPRCVAAGLVYGACPLGFWPKPSKTVLPLAGITDTGPACEG